MCCVLKTVRSPHRLTSCRNLLGLRFRHSTFHDGLESESGIHCNDPGGGFWFGRMAADGGSGEAGENYQASVGWFLVMPTRIRKTLRRGQGCWARIFSWLREYSLHRNKSMKAGETVKDGIKQQQSMEIMADMTKKIKVNGKMFAKNSWWDSDLLAAGGY